MSSSDSDFENPKKTVPPHKQFLENATASRKKNLFQDMLARNANPVAVLKTNSEGPSREKDKRASKCGADQHKSPNKQQLAKTHVESEESSSDYEEDRIQKPASTSKADDSSSSWDSDSKTVPTGRKQVPAKQQQAPDSDLTSDSEDDEVPANQERLQTSKIVSTPQSEIPKIDKSLPKSADSSSDFSDSEDEVPAKKPQPQPSKKAEHKSADDTSDSDDETKKSPKQPPSIVKAATGNNGALKDRSVRESSSNSDLSSEDTAKSDVPTASKTSVKAANISTSKPEAESPVRSAANISNNISESSDSSEDERPKKIQVIENIAFIPTPKKSPKSSGNRLSLKKETSSSEEDISNRPKDVLTSRLKNYMSANDLVDVGEDTEAISNTDEVYMVRVPKKLDPKRLVDSKLHFDKPTKLKIDGFKYRTVVEASKRRACLLQRVGGECTVANVEIQGTITYNEALKTLPVNAVDLKGFRDDETTATPLPELKTRHPLFGSSFEDDIKLPEDVLQRIRHLVEKQRKWKLKNRTAPKRELDVAEDKLDQDIFNLLREHSSKKVVGNGPENAGSSKKKAIDNTVSPKKKTMDVTDNDSGIKKQTDLKKKRKHEGLSEELQPDIQDRSNVTKRKKKSLDVEQTLDVPLDQTINESEPGEVKKKKKKKSKHRIEETTLQDGQTITDAEQNIDALPEQSITEDAEVKKKKKKKKKSKHQTEETVVQDESTITGEETEKRKKKKKHRETTEEEVEVTKSKKKKRKLEECVETAVEEDVGAVKKKKKKHKREKGDV